MQYSFDNLSYKTPLPELIRMMKHMGSSVDLRVLRNQDIARCLLHNGAAQLEVFYSATDVRPWRTFRERVADAWAVYRQRAIATYVSSSVYDRGSG